MSHKAKIWPVPSIFDIVVDFMVGLGFNRSLVRVNEWGLSYDGWELGGTEDERFYMIPFKTNRIVYLNPADPEFFDKLKETLTFPKKGEPFGDAWVDGRWKF